MRLRGAEIQYIQNQVYYSHPIKSKSFPPHILLLTFQNVFLFGVPGTSLIYNFPSNYFNSSSEITQSQVC